MPARSPRSGAAIINSVRRAAGISPGARQDPLPNELIAHGAAVRNQASPDEILQCFNTRKYRREHPDNLPLMQQTIADSVSREEAVTFLLYWGKGPRQRVGQPEIACLARLAELTQRVGKVYSAGATFKLILTDTHAELNGYSVRSIAEYFTDVALIARKHGFDACWLSRLLPAAGPREVHEEGVLSGELLEQLTVSAEKWYRGDGGAGTGAEKYYRMNLVERRAVEASFPGTIFATFNDSTFRGLFPDRLPIFYMYSIRRGFCDKPWFLPDPAPSGYIED